MGTPRVFAASAGETSHERLAYLLTTTSTAPSTPSSCSQASARSDARSAGSVSSVTRKMRSALVSAARVASSGAEVVSMSTTWWVVSRSFRTASVCSLVSASGPSRSEEHTSELQSQSNLVCRLLLEKKKKQKKKLTKPKMPITHHCYLAAIITTITRAAHTDQY